MPYYLIRLNNIPAISHKQDNSQIGPPWQQNENDINKLNTIPGNTLNVKKKYIWLKRLSLLNLNTVN